MILCPLAHHAALRELPVDLVINTGSMQEMSEEWVGFYTEYLDRQRSRWFYSLNYFAQPIAYLAESTNLWSPRVGPRWVARLLRWNPGFVRMQSERNFLEAIYEKDVEAPPPHEQVLAIACHLDARRMTGELFVEYMDLVRRNPLPALMARIVRRVMDEMPYHPKEAAYLIDMLLTAPESTEFDHERLRDYRRMLEDERRGGVEAIY